jgi:hypothetical protein
VRNLGVLQSQSISGLGRNGLSLCRGRGSVETLAVDPRIVCKPAKALDVSP